MKIKKIETIYLEEFPNLLWVQVYTDDQLIGLGETFFGAAAVEAHIHEFAAPYLLEKSPLEIEALKTFFIFEIKFFISLLLRLVHPLVGLILDINKASFT